MNPDFERRGSKNSIFPSSTMFSFFGLCASMGWMGSSADIAGGAAIVPMDSSDTINVRNLIISLPKKRGCGGAADYACKLSVLQLLLCASKSKAPKSSATGEPELEFGACLRFSFAAEMRVKPCRIRNEQDLKADRESPDSRRYPLTLQPGCGFILFPERDSTHPCPLCREISPWRTMLPRSVLCYGRRFAHTHYHPDEGEGD